MTVAIVGAGPAGLLAAWAAERAGHEVVIFDPDPTYRPERIFSLQYLHVPCDLGFAARRLALNYRLAPPYMPIPTDKRSREVMREVYNVKLGRPREERNSTRFIGEPDLLVWSLKDAYMFLYTRFADRIDKVQIESINALKGLTDSHATLVVNTAPLDKLAPDLDWPVRRLWIRHDYTPVENHPADTCIYNLDLNEPWYRATRLDGGTATEYVREPEGEVRPLRKIVTHTNDLGPLPDNLIFTGRWGSWDASRLTHHAYYDTRNWLERNKDV